MSGGGKKRGEMSTVHRVRCPGIRSKKKTGNSTKSISGQCVHAAKLGDGEVNDCLDRSDEHPFQEGKDSTFKEAANINLEMLKNCTEEGLDDQKYLGLECGE